MEQFQKIWAPIAAILGAVLLIGQLGAAFAGNPNLTTSLIILVSLTFIGAGIGNYAFARSDIKTKKGYLPKYQFHWVAKIILTLDIIFLIFELIYVLTISNAIADCCGFVTTNTSTATLPFSTSTPTNTPIPSGTPVFVPTGGLIHVDILTSTPSITPTPEMNAEVIQYPAVEGDTFPKVSRLHFSTEKYGTPIAKANCISLLHAGDILTIKYYVVKQGDTLNSIAAHFDVLVNDLRDINDIDGDFIRTEDIIILPVCN